MKDPLTDSPVLVQLDVSHNCRVPNPYGYVTRPGTTQRKQARSGSKAISIPTCGASLLRHLAISPDRTQLVLLAHLRDIQEPNDLPPY
jgi:hypothetical protein